MRPICKLGLAVMGRENSNLLERNRQSHDRPDRNEAGAFLYFIGIHSPAIFELRPKPGKPRLKV